mgnify:CR=1 FL=1
MDDPYWNWGDENEPEWISKFNGKPVTRTAMAWSPAVLHQASVIITA